MANICSYYYLYTVTEPIRPEIFVTGVQKKMLIPASMHLFVASIAKVLENIPVVF